MHLFSCLSPEIEDVVSEGKIDVLSFSKTILLDICHISTPRIKQYD